MKRYLIKEAFILQSAGSQLMRIGQYYATDDEQQLAELEKFEKDGSVENVAPREADAEKEESKDPPSTGTQDPPADPTEDITIVPGIGEGSQKKLAALDPQVKTLTELKAALEREDVKKALGVNYEKAVKYFAEQEN